MPCCRFFSLCSCCWRPSGKEEGGKQKVPLKEAASSEEDGDSKEAETASEGNPRNKCALSPGHSLMDWIRLGASGRDLTGVGPRAGHLSVTQKELATHCKEDDAWLAIRGKVYNVTAYLPFHPGGPQELMKGAGIDATQLFDQVHPWVNYDSILQKCLVGRLANVDPSVDSQSLFFGPSRPTTPKKGGLSPASAAAPGSVLRSPDAASACGIVEVTSRPSASDGTSGEDNRSRTSVSDDRVAAEQDAAKVELPRFDWIQKLNYITVIFYTRPFANPLIEIFPPSAPDRTFNIRLSYDGQVFNNELQYERPVDGNVDRIRVSYETGKVEVVTKKQEAAIWNNYGVLTRKHRVESVAEGKHPYTLLRKVQVNHNSYLVQLGRSDQTTLAVPIGKHVRVFCSIAGVETARSYTPIPSSVGSPAGLKPFNSTVEIPHTLWLLVKRYPEGAVSRALCDADLNTVFHVSKPLGSFKLSALEKRETFLMLAAGTGLTPMLQLIVFLLERRIRRSQCVRLLFFNKAEEDILLRDQLDNLQAEDNRFKVQYILSQPGQSWTGLRGHVDSNLLRSAMDDQLKDSGYTQRDVFFSVCGPPAFTTLSRDLLIQLHIAEDQFHLFAG